MSENLIGKRIPALDKGWIELVDLMPHPSTGVSGDLAIVNAARVSFMGESKGPERDKKLLFYLVQHYHTSPFEMVEFKFRVRAPLVVWWQWVRHRTWCLSGDTELYFDTPKTLRKGRKTVYKMPLGRLYQNWEHGSESTFSSLKKPSFIERLDPNREYTVRELAILIERADCDIRQLAVLGRLETIKRDNRIHISGQAWIDYVNAARRTLNAPMKQRIKDMSLRMCNEDTGEIDHTSITDVVQSGIKPVFLVTLTNDYSIKMSKDHFILTERGWMSLEKATELQFSRSGSVTWSAQSPAFAINGVPAYKDRDWLQERRSEGLDVTQIAERAGVSYHTIRKYLKIHKLQFTTKERSVLSGKAQKGRRRPFQKRGPMSVDALEKQSGKNSNFWKGGITSDRALMGRWTTITAPLVHQKFGYKCAICGASKSLHAHHIDPIWHNIDKAYDLDNLVTLCAQCHRFIHGLNWELDLLSCWVQNGNLSYIHQALHEGKMLPNPTGKKPRGRVRIVRKYANVKSIEYCGEEMTYDVSVLGPYHNFVANGFIVHNSFNAQSGRYTPFEENDFYVPDVWRKQAKDNKQASEGTLQDEQGQALTEKLLAHYEQSYQLYQEALTAGVSKEMARIFLPGFSVYYTWVAKIDAHNLMQFLRLRMASDAQYEIRVYANAIYEHFFKPALPWTAEAFERFILKAQPLETGSGEKS
ncbi:MAG: FAD-dependent thymidylate synthase [Aggregatilineales bacterium]